MFTRTPDYQASAATQIICDETTANQKQIKKTINHHNETYVARKDHKEKKHRCWNYHCWNHHLVYMNLDCTKWFYGFKTSGKIFGKILSRMWRSTDPNLNVRWNFYLHLFYQSKLFTHTEQWDIPQHQTFWTPVTLSQANTTTCPGDFFFTLLKFTATSHSNTYWTACTPPHRTHRTSIIPSHAQDYTLSVIHISTRWVFSLVKFSGAGCSRIITEKQINISTEFIGHQSLSSTGLGMQSH